jgi:CRP/FNR family cyclic AMP-dependent transcriptional regulator
MGHRISNGGVPSSMQRLIIWLKKLCAVNTADKDGAHIINATITVQQLAEILFIHPTTCSRLLATLEADGIISRTRTQITVFEVNRLTDYESLD